MSTANQSTPQIWTIQSILNWTRNYFTEKQIPTARLDAEILLSHVCQCSRMDLYLAFDKPMQAVELDHFRGLVKRRVQGSPVAYLVEEKGFWTLTLHVEPGVLIPRPDTEILVETSISAIEAWQEIHDETPCQILEVGTGTAAIPLALCSSLENLCITTTDISPDAIKVATQNIETHQDLLEPRSNQLELVHGDRLQMLPPEEPVDFIVSNPPYIPSADIPGLQVEVSAHEPQLALDGGADGLDFYRYLFEKSASFLKPEGEMLLEIGYDQVPGLEAILPPHLELVQVVEDLQSHPRVFHVKHCGL